MTSHHAGPGQGVIYWFRNDLRLHDQPALQRAIALAQSLDTWLLPVYVHDTNLLTCTQWGFDRVSRHRLTWTSMALDDLSAQLVKMGSRLVQIEGQSCTTLSELVRRLGNPAIVCEEIAAPEETGQVQLLIQAGLSVQTVWQSTLVAPENLPFPPEAVPDQFTHFRQAIERESVKGCEPLEPVCQMPRLPSEALLAKCLEGLLAPSSFAQTWMDPIDDRAAFPWSDGAFHGGERAALAHLSQYCQRNLPHTYKTTRNELIGIDYSTKWSPWLSTGALSPRQAWSAIRAFETERGASDSTYWIWFELLWRDHFRWLHRKYGVRLYQPQGLTEKPIPSHHAEAFLAWRKGQTGQAFIDCGMRELYATGYLSNRLRQNVASYLIHDLACDWRAGAAWFEAQLIDYDVYSNQGNWLYLSGRGTDPRGPRRFNPVKQAHDYDREMKYQQLWAIDRRAV